MRDFLRRLRGPWVTEDPAPQHGTFSPCACTYPTSAEINAALERGTTGAAGTSLLTPWVRERATREVMRTIYQGASHGEHGDIASLRSARGAA